MVPRTLALLVSVSLLASPGTLLAADEGMARLRGKVLDPEGKPASDLRVVLQNVATRKEYASSASDSAGEYTLAVPAGSSYRIIAAISPRGSRLAVRAAPPMEVKVPGEYRLPDVMFKRDDDDAAAVIPGGGAKVPWYQKPGLVIGIVAGGIALIALAAGDEDPEVEASPAMP